MSMDVKEILRDALSIVTESEILMENGISSESELSEDEVAMLVFHSNIISLSLLEERVFNCDISLNKQDQFEMKFFDEDAEFPSSFILPFVVENWYNMLLEPNFSLKNKVAELKQYAYLFEENSPIPDINVAHELSLEGMRRQMDMKVVRKPKLKPENTTRMTS